MKGISSILFVLLILFSSCKKDKKNDVEAQAKKSVSGQKSLLPVSTGTISSVYLYADASLAESSFKDSLLFHLNQPYLLTPNLSPAVNVTNYSFETFVSGGTRTANNLMLINVNEESKLATYVKAQLGQTAVAEHLAGKQLALVRVKDVNATPQQIFYLLTNGFPNLASKSTQKQLDEIAKTIIEETTKLDNQRLVTSFSNSREYGIEKKVNQDFGLDIAIPDTYKVVLEEDDFLWIIHETNDLYSNIVFYKKENTNDLPEEKQVLAVRDEFGAKITTHRENSRMTTNVESKPLPIQRKVDANGTEMLETRGLWQMVNDRLGGGFVNYSFVNSNNEWVSVDGFVYYAGDKKRRKMRDIDAIFSTIAVAEPEPEQE